MRVTIEHQGEEFVCVFSGHRGEWTLDEVEGSEGMEGAELDALMAAVDAISPDEEEWCSAQENR